MVIGIGGPFLAVTTSLACVLVATFTGIATSLGLDRVTRAVSRRREEATAVVTSTSS